MRLADDVNLPRENVERQRAKLARVCLIEWDMFGDGLMYCLEWRHMQAHLDSNVLRQQPLPGARPHI